MRHVSSILPLEPNLLTLGQSDFQSLQVSLPKLNEWYLQRAANPPGLSDSEDFHLFVLARALCTSQNALHPSWSVSIEQIINAKSALMQHILDTDALAVTMDTSVVDLYGILAEQALINNHSQQAFNTLAKLADKTGLAAFRFLVAWIAFNVNDLEHCINECEKVNEPFAPIHTLLGQALLESGKVQSAIEALTVAAEIAPRDPLPLVQLIKAYMIIGRQQDCFAAINRCRKIVGNNLEIECLASMAILAGHYRPQDFCMHTLGNIAARLEEDPQDFQAFAIGMELAAELNLKNWAQRYAESWDSSKLTHPQQIAKELAKILKRHQERNWHDVSRIVLDKTITIGNHADLKFVMQ